MQEGLADTLRSIHIHTCTHDHTCTHAHVTAWSAMLRPIQGPCCPMEKTMLSGQGRGRPTLKEVPSSRKPALGLRKAKPHACHMALADSQGQPGTTAPAPRQTEQYHENNLRKRRPGPAPEMTCALRTAPWECGLPEGRLTVVFSAGGSQERSPSQGSILQQS